MPEASATTPAGGMRGDVSGGKPGRAACSSGADGGTAPTALSPMTAPVPSPLLVPMPLWCFRHGWVPADTRDSGGLPSAGGLENSCRASRTAPALAAPLPSSTAPGGGEPPKGGDAVCGGDTACTGDTPCAGEPPCDGGAPCGGDVPCASTSANVRRRSGLPLLVPSPRRGEGAPMPMPMACPSRAPPSSSCAHAATEPAGFSDGGARPRPPLWIQPHRHVLIHPQFLMHPS